MPSEFAIADTEWSHCEAAIRCFEDAWQAGLAPDIAPFVPADFPHRIRLLVELVHIDMEFRLRAGDPARAEDYLARFADLCRADITLDLLAAEYALRNRHRPPAWPEEYLLRFPEHIRELRALLSEAGGPAGLSATRPAARPLAPLLVAPTILGYYVLGELGRGGMGVVYKARDLRLHRTVAVKTLAAVPTADTSARFTREAEAIARLDHPHIVPVYEVGEWQAGPTGPRVPFFVMKWYPGGSLDTAPAGPGSDPAAHARAVEAIARAVHHAHQRGVLHRDLKPSNILLDEAGVPHVADFGLAGRFDPADPKTLTAAVVGTPAYMAPEQARSPSQVSTAADVYGLGAILYHQLTGAAPFRADTPLATLDLVANAPVPRPSAVNPAVPRDLETVCLKCLDKDPDRRYPSADEVAADLRRWLAGRPITARPTPAWEHAWRWARRHPVVAGMGATTVVALLATVVTLAVSFARVRQEEAETAAALEQERRAKADMADALEREQRALYLERVASAGRLYAANQLPQAWALLDQCPPRFRGWEWRYLDSLRRSGPVALAGHEAWVVAAAFLADGRLVSADATGGVKVWDVARGAEQRGWRVGRAPVLAAHPARSWVAAADEKSVAVWDADTGRVVRRLEGSGRAAFGPDGSWVAATDGPVVRVWKVPSWEPAWVLAGHTDRVSCLAFDPAGGRLVTGSADGTVRGWDLATGKEAGAPWRRPRPIIGLAFTADGAAMVEAHPEGAVIADPRTGRHTHRLTPTAAGRTVVAAGPNPERVVVTGANAEVIVWNGAAGRADRVYRGHTARVSALALSRDGRRLASAGGDQVVRVWDLAREPDVRTLADVGPGAGGLCVSADGARLVIGPRAKPHAPGVLVLDAATGRETCRLVGAAEFAFHPTAPRVLTSRPGGGVAAWDAATGAAVWDRPLPGGVVRSVVAAPGGRRLVVSPDGRWVAHWDVRSRGVHLWAADDGTPLGTLAPETEFVSAMAASPDGRRLAVVTPHDTEVWDVAARARTSWPAGGFAVAFTPDGTGVAVAEADRVVRLRDATTGRPVREFVGSPLRVTDVAFRPDGTRLATAGSDDAVRVWDLASGRELLSLPGVTGPVSAVAWDHTGCRLYCAGDAVRVWEVDGRGPPGSGAE